MTENAACQCPDPVKCPRCRSQMTPVPASAASRIRWENGRYGSIYGYVGTLKTSLFSISHSTTRGDEFSRRLRSSLPGYTTEWKVKTEDEAMLRAEAILRGFLRRLDGMPAVEREAENA